MLRDITLGQYYPADSVLHRLDPRVKLMGTLIYVIALFLCGSIPGVILMAVFLICLIIISKVPFTFMIRGLRAILVLLILAGIINILFTPGVPIFSFGIINITWLGIRNAAFMVYRMVFLIIGTSIMTLTTTPNMLTAGLEKGLGFLKVFKIPVHEVAMMMGIALRFIPLLMEETDRIMKAQQARGADFTSGGIVRRAKSLLPVLIPLFVSAFKRANDLALAMEARCYHGGEGRTKMRPLTYNNRDYIAYLCILILLCAAIIVRCLF